MTQNQIQVRAKDEDMKGAYSNVMQATHTQEEFILDFFLIAGESGSLASRIILSPGHFKRLVSALEANLKKYEDKFGAITAAEQPGDIGFLAEK